MLTLQQSCLEVPHPLTVVEAEEGKCIPREEGAPLGHRETLHFCVCLHRFLDGTVFPIQPVPAPHAPVQARVNLEKQVTPGDFLSQDTIMVG